MFVARHSHASYPRPCDTVCLQEVRKYLRERRNGKVEWTNNGPACGEECLKPLPLTVMVRGVSAGTPVWAEAGAAHPVSTPTASTSRRV